MKKKAPIPKPNKKPNSGSSKVKVLKNIGKITGLSILFFFLITTFWVISLRYINPPVNLLMVSNYLFENFEIHNKWKSFDEMSKEFPLAVISAEDQNFFNHSGFDFKAIERAIEHNSKKNVKTLRGASTISQQTAKNVFLWPSRSWIRKGLETYFTVMIELFWGKKRIIEVYCNVVELGPGIYGVESASQKFFKKSSEKNSRGEAALLAAVLPNPIKFKVNSPSSYTLKRKNWISNQMTHLGGVNFLYRLKDK